MIELATGNHGTYTRYTRGCLCDPCRQAGVEFREGMTERLRECREDDFCGTNARYAHGCRGEACGQARLIYQRNKRGSKHPRPSKYDTPTPPEVIDRWRGLLGGTRG